MQEVELWWEQGNDKPSDHTVQKEEESINHNIKMLIRK